MSPVPSIHRRRELAARIREHRDPVAELVTDEFLRRHPDWTDRYGDLARVRCVEDARFHMDFLAGAVEAGDLEAIARYVRWTARVLESRGIDRSHLDENLDQVGRHLRPHVDPEDREALDRFIRAARAAATASASGEEPEDVPDETLPDLYLDAALVGRRKAALGIALEMLRQDRPVADVYTELLLPAQYEVGRRWEMNEISVAQEHMATAVTQYVLAELYSRLEIPEPTRGGLVVTGVEGELHQVGAHMVADILEADGWNVRFLGTQMPHRDILSTIEEHRPRIVGISVTMLFNLPRARALIEDIRRDAPGETRLLVGGGALRSDREVWREIGADGYGRDLHEAVAVARSLSEPASPGG